MELKRKLNQSKFSLQTCPQHNDPLKVYCDTCQTVICRDCTISSEHSKHQFELITECYPKHYQQIKANLDLIKCKTDDMHAAVTALVTREREVAQHGEEVKEQIHTHAQQLIDQIQRSERQLLQQVDAVVQQKKELLTRQREQAERVYYQLKTCNETVEKCLKELHQQKILVEKQNMLYQMKAVSQHVDPTAFQPIEEANTKFTHNNKIGNGIGKISSYQYGKAILNLPRLCTTNTESTATLTLQSHDGSPFSLPPSLISCKLSSSGDSQPIKCDINQTKQGKYKYNVSFTPTTTGEHQLTVQVGGVNIYATPYTLPVISSMMMRGKPVKTIAGPKGPRGITVCSNGDIVVAELGAHCVTIVSKEGKKVRSFGTRGTKEGQFTCPQGVVVSNDGHILVTDNHRLQKLTFDGVCVQSVGSSKSGSGQRQLYYPRGITVHPITGHIFVADSWNNRIQVFTNDLIFSHTIILLAYSGKRFNFPYAIHVSLENEEHLYVAEYSNHCITKLTTKGQYITRFGSEGSAPGQLYYPSSLIVHNSLVYVCEEGSNRVSVFDTKGTHLHCSGKRGSGKGEFNSPSGITTDTNGNLYVSDSDNNRIVMI